MMIHKSAIEVEMVNPEDDDDSTFTTTSELLDTSIGDVRNNKETMVSTIDSVINLMKRVEYEEKAAEQAREELAQGHSNIMLKVNQLMHKQQQVKEKNDMLAREACEQKKLLSAKMEALQLNVTCLKDKGDGSLELLNEMGRSLEVRLNSALMRKKLAINNKKVIEASARAALAYQEVQTTKVEEESKRLKQDAVEISKLQELLIDREHLVTTLHKEIFDKCREVKRLKKELDQGVKISCSRKSSISASLNVFTKGYFIDDHVQAANCKQIKSVVEFSEVDMKKPHGDGVADIAKSIKNVKIKGKLHANQMFAKCIKKVKVKGKLHGNKLFANRIKKIKINNKLHRNQICGKRVKKLKIKGKRHGNLMRAKSIKTLKMQDKRHGSQGRAKSIKKVKIKNKLNGSRLCPKSIKKVNINGKQEGCQMCAISIKKVKIKGKRHGNQKRAKSIKTLKMQDKRHGSQGRAKSVKKVKIKNKPNGSQLCPNRIKKVNINGKQQGCQMCAVSVKKVKIKGLQVVYKRSAAANH